ncbi:MAG: 2Fe-2S iron-sulfur cluster-binding protein, partial [Acidobacteriota bacterium]
MVKISINGKEIEVKDDLTILKAAESAGIHIPHLCYHPAFPAEGSCRMCLVEIEGLPKLELACSTVVKEGMKISTNSPSATEARRAVLEFLLAEHPLDCPICDKAGECKLQDYFEEYGLFEGRFAENKIKKVKKVSLGKNIILDKERCILCTRCIRFLQQILKTGELGVFQRGLQSEVGTFPGFPVTNNYSGNLAQLCPVGAITDKDFRFQTRTWFLRSGESICPLCSRGCRILIESHIGFPRVELDKYIYRIQAAEDPEVNGYWLCDLGRYSYSYLEKNRASQIKSKKAVQGKEIEWKEIISILSDGIKKLYYKKQLSHLGVIVNSFLTNEEIFLLKKIFMEDLGVDRIYLADPPDEMGDDFLMTPERIPNKRGIKEVGLTVKELSLKELEKPLEALIIFGNSLLEAIPSAEIKAILKNIPQTFLLTPYQSSLDDSVDYIMPTSLIAEKEGSLTNIDGILRIFSPALETKGEALSEWNILRQLALSLGF